MDRRFARGAIWLYLQMQKNHIHVGRDWICRNSIDALCLESDPLTLITTCMNMADKLIARYVSLLSPSPLESRSGTHKHIG